MELLSVGFVKMLIKVAVCFLPGVVGIYIMSASEELKRKWRNEISGKLFGVSNAIAFSRFSTALVAISVLLLVFSLLASWLLLLRVYF